MSDELVRERRGNVLVARLNRPEARNALDPALMRGIAAETTRDSSIVWVASRGVAVLQRVLLERDRGELLLQPFEGVPRRDEEKGPALNRWVAVGKAPPNASRLETTSIQPGPRTPSTSGWWACSPTS